jgi:hypothetical protein
VLVAFGFFLGEITCKTFKFLVIFNPKRLAFRAPSNEIDVGAQGSLFGLLFQSFRLQGSVSLHQLCNVEELFGGMGVDFFEVAQCMVGEFRFIHQYDWGCEEVF